MNAAHLEALRSRAKTGLLASAENNWRNRFDFWQGHLDALRCLQSGVATGLAAKDERLNGYEPPAHLKAAWAALPVGAERISMAEVQQFLAAQGVQVTAQLVANGNLNACQQFKNSEVAAVNLHDEHAAALVDGNDGAGVAHGGVSFDGVPANVAQQGGAA